MTSFLTAGLIVPNSPPQPFFTSFNLQDFKNNAIWSNSSHPGLQITDSRSPVMMTGQIFFSLDKPRFWPVK